MYELLPLVDSPARAAILEEMVRKVCAFDTAFSDFQDACEEQCFRTKSVTTLCPECAYRFAVVAASLATGLNWEVWKTSAEGTQLVGIIRLSNIRPGVDALGHYVFFDHDLRGKTGVIKEFIDWCFSPHEGWSPLRRMSIEVPDFAFSLVRHATKKLGFGGEFKYTLQGKTVPVEGVRREAILWRGVWRDLLYLGLQNPNS